MMELEDLAMVKAHPVVVVVAYSPTCPHCHQQLQHVATAEQLAGRGWVAGRIDSDKPAIARRIGDSVPVTFLYRDGKAVARATGSMEGSRAVAAWVKAKLEAKPEKKAPPRKPAAKATSAAARKRPAAGRRAR